MTNLQTPPSEQRIPLAGSAAAFGVETATFESPLVALTAMQTALEGAREQAEETQVLRPISSEDAEHLMQWAATDSLDWDRLIGSIEGWGTPEP
jgi:hypothetical protein